MGTKIGELFESKPIKINDLKGKVLAVDAFNLLYQFLTTIRQSDGTPLKDSRGRVTSHLVGLFSRTTNLMGQGIKLVFVFDGKVPDLKNAERQRRKQVKQEAQKMFEDAEAREDLEGMKKYAGRTSVLTPEMVSEAKQLIKSLGLPIIDAPSEGEAQAARIVANGDAWAIVSQDADSLLFKAPKIVKNLSITARRKKPGKLAYETVTPELIMLEDNMKRLGLNQDELIILAMLVGTDYNIGGIKGIGPKKALDLLKKNNSDPEKIFEEVKWSEHFDYSWQEVFDTIKHIKITDDYKLEFKKIDKLGVVAILVNEHEFSMERVDSALQKLLEAQTKGVQKSLGEF